MSQKLTGQAIVFTAPGVAAIQETAVQPPANDEVLVKITHSIMSPGTERRCLQGIQPGDTFPFVPGYAAAGHIVQADADSGLAEGQPVVLGGGGQCDLVSKWGGHASLQRHPATDVSPIPEGLSPHIAAITKIAAIAYHGFRRAAVQPNEQTAVIGLGLIGQLSARLFATECSVRAMDLDASRVEMACQAGLNADLVDPDLQPLLAELNDAMDIVVDVTGVPAVLPKAMGLIHAHTWGDTKHPLPRYVIQGSYDADVSLPYFETFCKEAMILLPRDEGPEDRRAILQLLAEGRLVIDDLLTDVRTPADAPNTYADLFNGSLKSPTVLFDWT